MISLWQLRRVLDRVLLASSVETGKEKVGDLLRKLRDSEMPLRPTAVEEIAACAIYQAQSLFASKFFTACAELYIYTARELLNHVTASEAKTQGAKKVRAVVQKVLEPLVNSVTEITTANASQVTEVVYQAFIVLHNELFMRSYLYK
jgi:hypothetical protein